ncbi:hypothetical protein P154DRAFT_419058 [Amniculicola lignicola CBS 123094]|uniref:Uncharacterized protein n=1 Tax=Amniculicola lignicola CBS 123094 TaxID=1392246 RepID=A0A6A5X4I0_9PLEO|nr:hypothetical protein P154DRAFT_419058 [Amniculicola lignicola CBS 123094]
MTEDDIAAAMGFSSFGSTKKRKYDQANSPKPKADSSGANSTRLGVRPKASSTEGEAEGQESPLAQPGPRHHAKGQDAANPSSIGEDASEGKPPSNAHLNSQDAAQNHAAHSDMVSFPGRTISRHELRTLKSQGVLDDQGHTAFFDPSFIEDPWAHLT